MSARSGALRRRRKRSIATRLRIGWIFIVVGAAAFAYGVYALVTLPALRVRAVDVTISGPAVSEREVRAAAAVDPSRNVWLSDTASMARRIEAIPYVDRAIVQHVPPASLAIAVTQREPAVCVVSGNRTVSVDATRRILQEGCAAAGLLTVQLEPRPLGPPGTTAAAPTLAVLLADADQLEAAGLKLRSVRQDRFGGLIAVDTAGIELRLGADGDLTQKAGLVGPVLAAAHFGRPVRAVDLRAPGTPTVEFR